MDRLQTIGPWVMQVLAVDNNENVLKVARNYFGFQGS